MPSRPRRRRRRATTPRDGLRRPPAALRPTAGRHEAARIAERDAWSELDPPAAVVADVGAVVVLVVGVPAVFPGLTRRCGEDRPAPAWVRPASARTCASRVPANQTSAHACASRPRTTYSAVVGIERARREPDHDPARQAGRAQRGVRRGELLAEPAAGGEEVVDRARSVAGTHVEVVGEQTVGEEVLERHRLVPRRAGRRGDAERLPAAPGRERLGELDVGASRSSGSAAGRWRRPGRRWVPLHERVDPVAQARHGGRGDEGRRLGDGAGVADGGRDGPVRRRASTGRRGS